MLDYGKVKAIIWDLDETFWKGTLSEGTIEIPDENIQLIKTLADCGVVCSICSKNNAEQVRPLLKSAGLEDFFVFQSIDWSNKGPRVKQIIEDMHLRNPNILFVDDNPTNRAEVEHFCPGIVTADIWVISQLCQYFDSIEKKDIEHKRLTQYKVLEQKREKARGASSITEFLLQSHIKVTIHNDFENQLDRIEELVLRTNQLNFTKVRSSKEELRLLIDDKSCNCGYVCVSDDFGEYGVSGFFAVKDGIAEHFIFSCRVLGMGVEQYVYNIVGKPRIVISGEVASDLNDPVVTWINVNNTTQSDSDKVQGAINKKIVIHGPCDLESVFGFIQDSPNIIKEFNYVNSNGISIEQRNCTTHIVESLTFSRDIRESESIKRLPFYDEKMYDTALFDTDTEFAVLSLFTDPCLSRYKEKDTGLIVCFGDSVYDLTDATRMDEYITRSFCLHNCRFTAKDLEYIQNHFEYIGRIQPEEVVKNVDFIYEHLAANCKLLITLQSEMPYMGSTTNYSYDGVYPKQLDRVKRHVYNKTLNDLLRIWAADKQDVFFLDFNKYIKGQQSFRDHISHFTRDVYYDLSCELVDIISKTGSVNLTNKSRLELCVGDLKQKVSMNISRMRKIVTKKMR